MFCRSDCGGKARFKRAAAHKNELVDQITVAGGKQTSEPCTPRPPDNSHRRRTEFFGLRLELLNLIGNRMARLKRLQDRVASSTKFPCEGFNLTRAAWPAMKYYNARGRIAILTNVILGFCHSTIVIV